MMRVALAAILVVLCSGPAFALNVVGSVGAGFDTVPGFPDSTAHLTGIGRRATRPTRTSATSCRNWRLRARRFIGNANSPNLATPLSSWQILADPLGGADLNVSFTQGAEPAEQALYVLEVTALASTDEFGYYTIGTDPTIAANRTTPLRRRGHARRLGRLRSGAVFGFNLRTD